MLYVKKHLITESRIQVETHSVQVTCQSTCSMASVHYLNLNNIYTKHYESTNKLNLHTCGSLSLIPTQNT